MKVLREYQTIAAEKGADGNLLNADDKGLGKTVVSIETARLIMYRQQSPVLVVVPKTLKPQWAEEIADQDATGVIVPLDVTTEMPKHFASNKPFWVLAHYESVMRHQKLLAKTFWAAIIVDEAHRIKNRKAQRTVAIKKLEAYRKLALTGTPYDRNPADMWSILNWLAPGVFRSYWNFYQAHVKETINPETGQMKIAGVKDGARFARVIAPYVIQRSKQEVAPQLPAKIIQHRPVMLTPAQEALYKRIAEKAESFDIQLDNGERLDVPNYLARILRLQQVAVDPKLLGTTDNGGKIDWLLEYVDDNPDDTLLVFTRFRDTAIRVAHMLGVPYIVGGDNSLNGKRPEDCPRLVATIDAVSEGYNLGQIWHTVFLDQVWSSITMQQALDRTERDLQATQARRITYLHAIASNGKETVDALVRDAVAGKWSTVEMVNAWLRSINRPGTPGPLSNAEK